MRFDQVDGNSAAAGRKCDAVVERLDAARLRFGHPAAEEEIGTLLTDRHKTSPVPCLTAKFAPKDEEMVNATMTLLFRLCPK
jgi:hypothetical protein